MDDVVPSALQRLRAADIIRMAGLAVASLGQEYCRIGAVHATQRQGAQLLGLVDLSNFGSAITPIAVDKVDTVNQTADEQRRYAADVEIQNANLWQANCTCSPNTNTVCSHVAALLYQWLAHPASFAPQSETLPKQSKRGGRTAITGEPQLRSIRQPAHPGYAVVTATRGPTPLGNLSEILAQLGLSELRGIAREYDIAITGLNKPQLAEAIASMLQQSEVVRKVASALEKPQRQLLATITLAGGSITDDDLRSLFERFSFGSPDKLQGILLALQSKGLLFRTSLNSAPQQRIGLSGSLFDFGWHVPAEVHTALHVSVPVTPFDVHKKINEESEELPELEEVERYHLLTDLLLVGRALDGYKLEHADEKDERPAMTRAHGPLMPSRTTGMPVNDSTSSIAPPAGLPSSSLLERLQTSLDRPPLFLRYAFRLLRLADILHKDDTGIPYLRLLPNAARLLLGPANVEIARDLFELWLIQPGYEELFELQEEGLRLRCRTTPLNHSILRPGELELENSEARQILVALVAQAPLNQWISFSAFARFIYRLNPAFLQKRQRLFPSPHWWLEQEEGRPLQPAQMADWMRAEGHYLARLIRGPLHWWGICDLALSPDGRLLAFRLTSMAALLLHGSSVDGQEEQAPHEQGPTLDVSADGELLITCTFSAWPLLELIEDFAEVAGIRGNQLSYRLTPKALADAMRRGQHPGALIALLEQMSQGKQVQANGPLTQLLNQLKRWAASFGRVRLYTGVSLLEAADTLVMRELSATTSVEEQLVKAISPTLMILKKQGTERIIEDLKRRGQTPLLHEEEHYGTE